jgi:hypothetical protein
MAITDLELLLQKTRYYLKEQIQLRYAAVSTTGAGAAGGTTVISSALGELSDHWNGCECVLLGDGTSGPFPSRIVEDFSAGTLSFTNNPFPDQVATSQQIELGEVGIFSNRALKQYLADAINYLAGVLPKSVLRGYIVVENVTSSAGLADLPAGAIDIHEVRIAGVPTVPLPVERRYRMINAHDFYLAAGAASEKRFVYIIEGTSPTGAQLFHYPVTSQILTYSKVPYFTWPADNSGATNFPDELHDAVAMYAASLALLANEDVDLANLWMERTRLHLESKGIKYTSRTTEFN